MWTCHSPFQTSSTRQNWILRSIYPLHMKLEEWLRANRKLIKQAKGGGRRTIKSRADIVMSVYPFVCQHKILDLRACASWSYQIWFQFVSIVHANQACFRSWSRPLPPLQIDKSRNLCVIWMQCSSFLVDSIIIKSQMISRITNTEVIYEIVILKPIPN